MPDKFHVTVTERDPKIYGELPSYFEKFYRECRRQAMLNNWTVDAVINNALKPHGRLIKTKTQGWYLRWDDEKYHTFFVLRWS